MAALTQPYTFTDDTVAVSAGAGGVGVASVNGDFDTLYDFLNNQLSYLDGSVAFTAQVPTTVTAPPTADAQAVRKRYADNSPELKGLDTAIVNNAGKPSLTSGSFRWQAGTTVAVYGFGAQVTFPSAFPSGLLCVTASIGDSPGTGNGVVSYVTSEALTGFIVTIGNAGNGQSVRVNWIALGW